MKNIYYPSADFHKAIKRNKVKKVFVHLDFWFYTQKAVIIYTPQNAKYGDVMCDWLKKQGVEIDER